MSDLSDYEKIRLANIQKNAAFLATLGLDQAKPKIVRPQVGPIPPKQKRERQVFRPKKKEMESASAGARKSRRLQAIGEEEVVVKNEEEEDDEEDENGDDEEEEIVLKEFSYERMPLDSSDLDDHEFQIFASMREWRRLRCRELELEAYKICTNQVYYTFYYT
jgi:hypothetical protein